MTNTAPQYYEGCGRVGPIRCIFLSEFHPTAGSKISCQVRLRVCSCVIIFYKMYLKVPDGYVSKDVFDAVNVYIIPKPQLQRCIMTV